jgi:hypothetical protein
MTFAVPPYAATWLAEPLWCMFGPVEEMNVIGHEVGRNRISPLRKEVTNLVLTPLDNSTLARLF